MKANIVCTAALVIFLAGWFNGAQAQSPCTWASYDYKWWSNPSSWPSNTIPANGSDVVIPYTYKMVYDISQPGHFYNSITVQAGAQLIFDQDNAKGKLLDTNYIFVQPGATFRIGSAACPYTFKANIILRGPRDTVTSINGFGNKGIICGGTLEFWGTPPQPTWTRIASTVSPGSNSFTVQDNLSNWKVNDTIVLASTDYYQELSEEVQITAVSGKTITVNKNLSYMHYGAENQFAEVGSITRNIVIQGDPSSDASQFGGHVLMYGNSTAHIWGVEFTRMGQRNLIGRYPFHFHIMGDQMGKGHFVSECSFHHNYQRCFTVHGTSGILARNNVGWNVTGHCYFFEEGSEMVNYYDHNLGMLANPGQMIPTDALPSIFWITNPNNTFVNNAAVGGNFGFWYSLPQSPIGLTAYKTWIRPRNTIFGVFQNNIAHSAQQNGIHIDDGLMADGNTEEANYLAAIDPLATNLVYVNTNITNNISYKNREYGLWIRGNPITVSNFLLMDNSVGANIIAAGTLVKDTIIIGETGNIGTPLLTYNWNANGKNFFNDMGRSRPRLWELSFPIHGVEFYDTTGSQYARNVTYVNFASNSARLAGAVGVIEDGMLVLPPNVIVAQSILVNSNAFAMKLDNNQYDGPNHVVVHDADGTLTGDYGSYIVSNNSMLTYTNANCTSRPDYGGFYLCGKNGDGYSQISMQNLDTSSTIFTQTYGGNYTVSSLDNWFRATYIPFGQPGIRDQITGSSVMSDIRGWYTVNVPSRHGYVLQFPHPTPPSLQLNVRYAATGEWLVVAMSYPNTANFTLKRGYFQTLLTPVNSLSALSSTTYYYDPVLQYLYVMYFEDNGYLTSPVGGFPTYSWSASYVAIYASCGGNCSVAGPRPIPPALVDTEDKYKSIMKGCTAGVSNSYEGTTFINYNPKTNRVSYIIYHNVPYATSATFQDAKGVIYDTQVYQSPIKGSFQISLNRINELWNGNWSVKVSSSQPQSTILGFIGCLGSCSTPPPTTAVNPCAAIPGELDVFTDSLSQAQIWLDYSYLCTRVYNYTADQRCGSNALAVTYQDWGSLSFNAYKPWMITNFAYLQFDVKCPSGPLPFPLTVSAHSTNGTDSGQFLVTPQYIDNILIENSWTRVKIPLSALNFKGNEQMGSINFNMQGTLPGGLLILFDNIMFVPAYPDPLTQAPYGSVKLFNGPSC